MYTERREKKRARPLEGTVAAALRYILDSLTLLPFRASDAYIIRIYLYICVYTIQREEEEEEDDDEERPAT